ncbi:hypothetical protein N0M98_19260 [Paenibacillus doosanensis]|uniref:hypothetical protein n=1 Tax=Paenibacillus doosanensis TaxID=1229154 RepID=UPI002180218C|nr:hypothetical protein [Paenibacillus doosanensis]MCS7462283.1 hypothetical protein [Paenibacillus doosanensis]
MNAFIYDDDTTYFIMKDGKVDMAANKPEWKQGLAYARSLVKDGLIDTGAFTQNSDAYKQLGDKADAQLLGAGAAMHPGIFVTTGTERDKDYNPLPPLTGPGGAHNTLWRYGDVAGATFAITNKASEDKQIAAMKLIDYLFSEEGTTLGYFGEKGVSWKDAGPDDEGLGVKGKITPIAQAPNSPPLNNKWGALAQYYNTAEYRATWTAAKDIYTAEGYERRLFEATKLYEGNQPKEVYPYWSVWVDTAVADEAAMLRQNITDYIEQNMLQFVTGTKDLDKDWDAYVSGFNNLNLPRYLQIYQEAYDKSMK